MSSLKVINIGDPGTGFRFGGDDLDTVNMLLSGQDLGYNLKMENPFHFGGANKLRILRPDGIHYISINTEAETTNRSLLIKSFGADTYLVVGTDLLVKANLNANIAYKDETNWLATNMVQDGAISDAKLSQINDKAKQHPQTAYLDALQIFTNAQQISLASSTPLTVRNATNANGSTVGVQLHLRDSANNNTVFSRAESRIVSNTDTAEEGAYDIWIASGGTLLQQLSLVNEQLQIGRVGERIIFDTSQINTLSKTITWDNLSGAPLLRDAIQVMSNKDISALTNAITHIGDSSIDAHTSTKITISNKGQLPNTTLYTTDVQESTNKVHDMRKNTFLRRAKWGAITPDDTGGYGDFKNTNVCGDDGGISTNTAGKYRILNTTTTAGDWCGYAKLDNYLFRRNSNPLLRFAFLYQTAGSKRKFAGVKQTKGIVVTTSNSAPLGSGEAGFMFGYGIGDTEWQVFYNDSSATCNKTTTGIALPGADTNYIVEMSISNTGSGSFSLSFFSVNSDGSKGAQIGTTFTQSSTEIPGANTDLYFNDILVSTGSAVIPLNTHYTEVERN